VFFAALLVLTMRSLRVADDSAASARRFVHVSRHCLHREHGSLRVQSGLAHAKGDADGRSKTNHLPSSSRFRMSGQIEEAQRACHWHGTQPMHTQRLEEGDGSDATALPTGRGTGEPGS
jgi:hypothetical protein